MEWKKASLVGLIIGIILAIIIDISFPTSWGDPLIGGWAFFFIAHAIFLLIIILVINLIYFIVSKIKSK